MPEFCEIIVAGRLDPRWSEWLGGLQIAYIRGDQTLLSGALPDQAALHGLLERIRDLNLRLISVTTGDQSAPCSGRNDPSPGRPNT